MVTPYVLFWVRLPVEVNTLGFNSVVLLVVGEVPVENETTIETLSISRICAQSSKMLIEIEFAYVRSQW